jgi:molecular chaperone HscB
LRLRNLFFGLMEFYTALGLEPKLALDPEDLKKRFYERSRQWHPDRFSRAAPADQQKALDMTAMLNDAFRSLRDPVTRAEYFLKSKGLELSKDAPPELLEEVFELNMAIEELRSGDDSARAQLAESQDRFAGMRSEIDGGLAELYRKYDAAPADPVLEEIARALNRRRYISNLVREVAKARAEKEVGSEELNVHPAN